MPEETTVKRVGAATTHQLSEAQIADGSESLSDIELPFRVEGATLMAPGTWNGKDYTPEEIRAAYQRTDWDDVDVRALFNEHDDQDSRDWVGEVRNPRMEGNELVGDIDVVTADEARKLAYGARFGISPKVSGRDDRGVIRDYTYDNFSLVLDPAVKKAFLNSQQENSTDDEQDVKNVMVKSTMSDTEDTEELSSEELSKLEEIVTTVENSDVEELAEVISPFMGGRSSEELQSHIQDVIENYDDGEEEEMAGHEDEKEKEEEMKRDMEEIARRAAQSVVSEMTDDGDDEEELSVDAIADKVADRIEVENSDDEDDSSEQVDALKEELSQIKDQIASDDEEETIENKTPNPGSQSTGADDGGDDTSVQEMSDREIDKGAAKYLLKSQKKRIR